MTSSTTTDPTTNPQEFGSGFFNKLAANYESAATKDPMARLANRLIALAPPITSSSVVHDNACGPGILTSQIVSEYLLNHSETASRPEVHATDIAENMLSILQKKPEVVAFDVQSKKMDSLALEFEDRKFSHSFTNMAIYLLPSPPKGASEIYRTLKPGGTAVVTGIKQLGWPGVVQRAQKVVRPEGGVWYGPLAPEWNTKYKLVEVMLEGGFAREKVEVKEVPEVMEWKMLQGFLLVNMRGVIEQGVFAIGQEWSEEEKKRFWEVMEDMVKVGLEGGDGKGVDASFWAAVCKK